MICMLYKRFVIWILDVSSGIQTHNLLAANMFNKGSFHSCSQTEVAAVHMSDGMTATSV